MGAFEKAVPEEANKGPSLFQSSHVIWKGANTIFMSVDPLRRGHRRQFPERVKRKEQRGACFRPHKRFNLIRPLEKRLFI